MDNLAETCDRMEKDHAVAFKKKPHDGNMRSIAFAYGSAAHFSIPRFALAHVDGAGRRYDPVRAAAASDGRCMPFYYKSPHCRAASNSLPSSMFWVLVFFILRRTSIGSSLLRGAHLLRESLPTCLRSCAKARRSRRSYGAGASGVCVCARACVVRCVCARTCVCV